MKRIALITDFGNSHYTGILKGVISSIDPSIPVIDITHYVSPQNIIEGAFILRESYPFFGSDVVFLVVVDPGVGSDRRGIVIRKGGNYFIGPDNGIFEFVIKDGDYEAYEIVKNDFFTSSVSSTFHGRDIFAPLAALIASGRDFKDIISPVESIVRLEIPQPEVSDSVITGEIIYIDSFGNLITNIPLSLVDGYNCSVKIKNRRLGRIRRTYFEVRRGFPVPLIGSSDMLEIAIYCGSAERWFNIKRERLKSYRIIVNRRPIKKPRSE